MKLELGCEPSKPTTKQFAAMFRNDLPEWARMVKDCHASVD
ncbi:hypothetical protein [Azohydromonas lata]|uniref:Uncharacterized protein n=1 Tax=Azohydromonas lata TaxID=45677 RepID=A0ABU5INS5_9BURK|nr:hypothetical protein [Azohydromonas lata]MDZ5460540.1 hypothetical protein [Azohydromonas lata]